MSRRQRVRRDERRREAQRRVPSRRQVAAGATIAMGATLAATGSAQAATFTVTNLNDTGPGSLRQAIDDANSNGNASDDIVFASGLSGTINVGSASNYGLYAETAMNIQGDGRITLNGGPNADYVVWTGSYGTNGNPGDSVSLSGLTITGGDATGKNSASYVRGGGIFNSDFNLTVTNSTITGNHAQDDGGGIYLNTGSVTLVNSTVSGNTGGSGSDSYGGGIYSLSGDVVIRNSTLSGNTVGGDGGGIYVSSSGDRSLTIENSTIANNASTAHSFDDEGGGAWICCGSASQRLKVTGSTITGNRVGGSRGFGGGVYAALNVPSDVTINNTILANNSGTTGNDLYLVEGGQVGFSLIKDPSNSGGTLVGTGPNITGTDPQLGPLQNNGGPTATELPAASSPAIDKGAAFGLGSDQRGVVRPIDFLSIPNAAGGDGSDIGATELQPDNSIKLGKLKRNKKKGTAKLFVKVPLPTAGGTLTIFGKGLKKKTRQVADAATVKLPVIPKGKKRKQENATGKTKVKAKVTYDPTGGIAKTLKRKVKLLKRVK